MKPTRGTQQGLSKENLNVTNKKKQTNYLPSYIDNTGAWGEGGEGGCVPEILERC
jgi:hypothetical protein